MLLRPRNSRSKRLRTNPRTRALQSPRQSPQPRRIRMMPTACWCGRDEHLRRQWLTFARLWRVERVGDTELGSRFPCTRPGAEGTSIYVTSLVAHLRELACDPGRSIHL